MAETCGRCGYFSCRCNTRTYEESRLNKQKGYNKCEALQAEIKGLKKENEALEKLRNDAWSQTRGLKTKVDDIETKVERLKGLLRYVPNGPDNVVWAEKVQQALKEDE